MAKFLNLNGLTTFLNQLKQIFATEDEVAQVEADTDTYVLNIDYENTLAFDTKEIITDKVILLPRQEFVFSLHNGNYRAIFGVGEEYPKAFNEIFGTYGETYYIVWDDVTYKVIAIDPSAGTDSAEFVTQLGNHSILGSQYENTGEPFLLQISVASQFCTNDTSETHTIEIYKMV